MPQLGTSQVIRFATFEVDLQAQELRKGGLRLKLTGQPFQVLAILLEQPGTVITRDELQKRLWPDTFVDVDHNLNTAINKIREAVGDSAENPRFVETLPRRGYRFIAPTYVTLASKLSQQAAWSPVQPQTDGGHAIRELSRQKYLILLLICAAIILVTGLLYEMTRPLSPKVSGYTRITNSGRAKSFRFDALPVIATDGSRLYFAETTSNGTRYTLNQVLASGGETSPVPTPFQQNIELGDISRTRSEVLLHTFVAGESEMPLWILPLGGVPRRMGDVLGRDAAWSPNGERIAYAKGHELYVCKADGTETRKLLVAQSQVRWPRWSPDGRVLRFTLGDPGGWTSIEEVSAFGGQAHPLLPNWNGDYCCGNWTPDGKHYVFQSSASVHATSASTTDIWALPERTGLFRKAGPVQLTAGPMDFRSPVLSVDGKKLFVIGEQRRGDWCASNRSRGNSCPIWEESPRRM